MKPLTFEEALELKPGDMLYSTLNHNADGSPQRWKVNGQVKTWKTDSTRIRIPLKNGFNNYDAIYETDFVEGVCVLLSLEEGRMMVDPDTLEKGKFYRLTIRSQVVDKEIEWKVSGMFGGRFQTAGGHHYHSICILPHRQFIEIGLTSSQNDVIVEAVEIKPTYKEK